MSGVGFCSLMLPGELPVFVFYPSDGVEAEHVVGRYTLIVALDGSVSARSRCLVVISHGSGGSPLTHRNLALCLARDGFVVALLEHPGNNRVDNRLAQDTANLEMRPRHVLEVVDWFWASERFGPFAAVGLVGHSMGGYTVLMAARDARVGGLVLLAPAVAWLTQTGALDHVRVPVLMFTGELDTITTDWHANVIRMGLASDVEFEEEVVAKAGHYSFLSPFPEGMEQDPAGFDREGFHARLARRVSMAFRTVRMLESMGTTPETVRSANLAVGRT